MIRQDIIRYYPALFTLVVICVTGFLGVHTTQRFMRAGDGHQAFETFIQNVQSGKQKVSTQEWLGIMRKQEAASISQMQMVVSTRHFMYTFALIALCGIILQLVCFSYYSKKAKATQPNQRMVLRAP
jgi:hypothetical protein